MPYSRWNTIGRDQPGGRQIKTLPGQYFGFTAGTKSTGSMEAALNAWDTFTGGFSEAVAWGLPNSMGTPNLTPLSGITRIVVFAAPLIPHGVSGSSITALLRGDYDAMVDANADAVVGLALGRRALVRFGWEYNSGAGDSPTQGFEWAVAHGDPQNSNIPNGIAQVHRAQAYVENRWRARGFDGYAVWSGGTSNTSALSIANAIPTHGDPSLTCWDWDVYPSPPYGSTKKDLPSFLSRTDTQYDAYVAYCVSHGLLMGHSEYGQISNPSSPYTYNDLDTWFPWFYNKIQANSATVAWAIAYWQNQSYVAPGGSPVTLTENHSIAFSVASSGGAPLGSASTAAWVSNYPPGTSGPNVSGTANTLANSGSLQHSSDLGTHWVWTTDAAKQKAKTSWQASFGGVGEANGLGAQGLQLIPQPDVPAEVSIIKAPVNRRGIIFG